MASKAPLKPSVMEVMSWFDEDRVDFASMQFTDIMGIVKNVTMPKKELEEALTSGVWFDGLSIEGFARIAESDMFLMPDRSTYAVMPWKKTGRKTARLKKDDVVREALGDNIYTHLTQAQKQEWAAYRQHVGDWMRDRYLEIY